MYKLVLGLMAISLFVGCTSKEEKALLESYNNNITYHKHLQKTEKAELFDGENSVAVLTATHLYTPSYEKIDKRDEVFIVGVQFEYPDSSNMNFDKNATSGHANEYTLTLNNSTAKKVERLSEDDKRLEGISFVSEWGEYYEVTFPHARKRFSLVFENARYGKETLNFSKVAKFVYTKKGF
jgi:hypothetical protein